MTEPGWYKDPAGQPATQRFWDGSAWTAQLRPAPVAASQPVQPTQPTQPTVQPTQPPIAPSQDSRPPWEQTTSPQTDPHSDVFTPSHQTSDQNPFPVPNLPQTSNQPYTHSADPMEMQPSYPQDPQQGMPDGFERASKKKPSFSLSEILQKLPFQMDLRTVLVIAGAVLVLVLVVMFKGGSAPSDTDAIVADITKALDAREQSGKVDCPQDLPSDEGSKTVCTVVYDDESLGETEIIVTRKAEDRYSWEYGITPLPPDTPTTAPPAAPTTAPAG